MTADSLLDRYSGGRPGRSQSREAVLLSLGLTVGLLWLVPVASAVTGVLALVWVATVGIAYGIGALALRRVVTALLVALFVTMTVAANVPLASRAYLSELPGMLGPIVWLVHVPLLGLFVVFVWQRRYGWGNLTPVEMVLGAFVLWTVVAALLGTVLRRDTALYFSLLMFQAWLVYSVTFRAVRDGSLPFRTLLTLITIPVVGQAVVGVAQFVNGGTLGFTRIGEISTRPIDTDAVSMSVGPLGSVDIGLYVGGFAGMPFILASQLILVLPALLAWTLLADGRRRVLAASGFVTGAVVLRLSLSDAARGAFAVSLVILSVWIIRRYNWSEGVLTGDIFERMEWVTRRGHALLFCFAASAFAVFYPSSVSGAPSRGPDITTPVTDDDDGGNGGSSSDGGATDGEGDAAKTTGLDGADSTETAVGVRDSPDPSPETATTTDGASSGAPSAGPSGGISENVTVPLFNLSNLGVRLKQYAVGLDLFVQAPLFGIGGANFQYAATEYGLRDDLALHNIYLALLVETGIVGFLCYTTALSIVLYRTWRLSMLTDRDGFLVFGVLAGLVGYLAFAFWDHLALDRVTSLFPFWALSGVVVGEYYRLRSHHE